MCGFTVKYSRIVTVYVKRRDLKQINNLRVISNIRRRKSLKILGHDELAVSGILHIIIVWLKLE